MIELIFKWPKLSFHVFLFTVLSPTLNQWFSGTCSDLPTESIEQAGSSPYQEVTSADGKNRLRKCTSWKSSHPVPDFLQNWLDNICPHSSTYMVKTQNQQTSAQDLFWLWNSGITPSRVPEGPEVASGTTLGLAACKSRTLPTIPWLQPCPSIPWCLTWSYISISMFFIGDPTSQIDLLKSNPRTSEWNSDW